MTDESTNETFVTKLYALTERVAIITGGCGFLGSKHAEAIAAAGGSPVLIDVAAAEPQKQAERLSAKWNVASAGIVADITRPDQVQAALDEVLRRFGRVDILINNAANNPRVEKPTDQEWSRFENFSMAQWNDDLAVGLTGTFLCSQIFGAEMARRKRGVIVNVASFFSVVAPDQRVYRDEGLPENRQPVKPVSYSAVKFGVIGITKYLAAYWAADGVRVNALSPGGVWNGQPDEFVKRVADVTPMGRMGRADEFQGAILFLCSDASSYMTGTNLVIDGGRTCW